MAKGRVTRNFSFAKLRTSPGRGAMTEVGDYLRVRTITRTQKGLDEDGRSFAPYRGRSKKTIVDLTDTTQMLEQDYQPVRTTDNTVGMGFATTRSARIAEDHEKGAGMLPERRFLGVPASWIKTIKTILLRGLDSRLK